MDYPGKVITKNQVTPTQTSATGVWTLDDAAAATRNNNWPVAGVPNPISKSLRFNSADSAYLNRTPASAGNRKTWTWSGWVKRSGLGTVYTVFSAGGTNGDNLFVYLESDNTIQFSNWTAFSFNLNLRTSQVFRDPSAWYHIVLTVDTTQATASNRAKVYVNGTQVTAFSTATYPAQNFDTRVNAAEVHAIGARSFDAPATAYSGYLTEVNFIDGQALTPSSFGMTDPVTGVWEPLKYSGTYGTNGFYLNFKDATSTTTLGLDYSGNSNTWTTNNFSVTAGVGNDSLTDVPTPWIVYNTTGDVGGVVRGNYCTLNPLNSAGSTLSNGNLDCVTAVSGGDGGRGTIAVTSGKWYWEFVPTVNGGQSFSGIALTTTASGSYYVAYYANTGNKFVIGSGSSAYGATYTTNDVIGVALDLDSGTKTVTFYKNNVSQGAITITPSDPVLPIVDDGSGAATVTFSCNFGQRPFAYTPPSGFRSLCTTNLPASTVLKGSEYMNAVLYTGNGGTQTVTGVGFNPNLVWIKNRTNAAANHNLVDVLRGNQQSLSTSNTNAESNQTGNGNSLATDGFTLTTPANGNPAINETSAPLVAWNWKANGAGVTNTAGSITSTVSANTTSGFSIVTYTGTGANATVGHGLGVAPDMVIVKKRSASENWVVYHTSIGATKYLTLNLTDAETTSATRWNNTAPTSTVFSIGTSGNVNDNTGTYVAYCFDAISGFSAFGSYTGNGSADGPFVYTGFRPRWVMVKQATVSARDWIILDTARNTYNVADLQLMPNKSDAEATTVLSSTAYLDILSNGFKVRNTSVRNNENTATYIYAAFAENPFKNALAR